MSPNLLSSTDHADTVTYSPIRGSLIFGNSTPKWDGLAIGAANRVLRSNGTDVAWGQVSLATDVSGDLPFANLVQASAASRLVGRGSASGAGDYEELTLGTGLTMSGTSLTADVQTSTLLNATIHTDSVTQTVSRGSIIYGNSTPKWDKLTIGAANKFLRSDGTDIAWSTLLLPNSITAGRIVYGSATNTYGDTDNLQYDSSVRVKRGSANIAFNAMYTGAAAAGNKMYLGFGHLRMSDNAEEQLGFIQGIAEDDQSKGGLRFVARNNTDVEVFRVWSTGFMGIGTTTTPVSPLRINRGSGSPSYVTLSINDTNKAFLGSSGGNNQVLSGDVADDFSIASAGNILFSSGSLNSEKIRINTSGFLGIGSTSPKSKLHIEGASGWIVQDEQDTNPTATELDSLDAVAIYSKGNKFVIAYNNGGTITYISIPLDGSTTTWTHSTSAP